MTALDLETVQDDRTRSMLATCRQHGAEAWPLSEAPGVVVAVSYVSGGRVTVEHETCRSWADLRRVLGY